MVVNLDSKKRENNNNSTCQLKFLQNSSLMSIVVTPDKELSNIERESDMRKVHTSSENSLSSLFSCSIRTMYNRVYRAQNKRLMLKCQEI